MANEIQTAPNTVPGAVADWENELNVNEYFSNLIHSLHIESGIANQFGITSIHFYNQHSFLFSAIPYKISRERHNENIFLSHNHLNHQDH
jgi:hypothetical protein